MRAQTEDVAKARPQLTKTIEEMVKHGKWTTPGYTEVRPRLSRIDMIACDDEQVLTNTRPAEIRQPSSHVIALKHLQSWGGVGLASRCFGTERAVEDYVAVACTDLEMPFCVAMTARLDTCFPFLSLPGSRCRPSGPYRYRSRNLATQIL